eukprot:3117565-Ditylum_brightwellii.AAC.1
MKSNKGKAITNSEGMNACAQGVPRDEAHAYEPNKENKNTFGADAIKKEQDAIIEYSTFQVLAGKERQDDTCKDSDYEFANIWFIFDVKQDLRLKSRLVIGGHMVDPMDNNIYSSHMKQESARIFMTTVDLNGTDVT